MLSIRRFFTRNALSPFAAVVLLVLWALFCLIGRYLVFFPAVGLMLPAYICYVAPRAGRVPAFGCILIAAFFAAQWGGWFALLCALVLLLPPVLAALLSQDMHLDFWRSVIACISAVFACAMVIVLLLWQRVGGDLVLWLRDTLEDMLRSAPETDQLLYMLHAAGVLELPEGMDPLLRFGELMWINPTAREQLMRSLLYTFETGMRLQLPMQLVSSSILSGVLCAALPRWGERGRVDPSLQAPIPSFGSWALPRTLGRVISITLLALGLVMLMSAESAMYGAFVTLWAGVQQIMSLQGASTIYFWLKKTGSMRRGGRIAVIVLLAIFLGDLLWILGCADQFLDLRKLRLPTDRNEGEDAE